MRGLRRLGLRYPVLAHNRRRWKSWAPLVIGCLMLLAVSLVYAYECLDYHFDISGLLHIEEQVGRPRVRRLFYPDDHIIGKYDGSGNIDYKHGKYKHAPAGRKVGIVFHIIVVMYMLVGLNTVCDIYFCGALDEMVEKWDVKPDVAGATFMAAGGSAPELFTSLIGAVVTENDVGFGTIVGSAVFNVLAVIGCCGMAASEPIQLTWWPLFRDCTFYICGLGMLAGFASGEVQTEKGEKVGGGKISLAESIVLFLFYLVYCVLMYFNENIEAKVKDILAQIRGTSTQVVPEPEEEKEDNPQDGTSDAADQKQQQAELRTAGSGDKPSHPDQHLGASRELDDSKRQMSRQSSNGHASRRSREFHTQGTGGDGLRSHSHHDHSLDRHIRRVHHHSHVVHHHHHAHEDGHHWSRHSGTSHHSRHSGQSGACSFHAEDPSFGVAVSGRSFSTVGDVSKTKSSTVVASTKSSLIEEPKVGLQKVEVHESKVASMEIEEDNEKEGEANYETEVQTPVAEEVDSVDTEESDEDDIEALMQQPEDLKDRIFWFLCLPVYLPMYYITPRPDKYFLATFGVALLWIAGFSFWLVYCVEIFGEAILGGGNSVTVVLGFTLLAAGTSIPDLVSSMAVARIGEGDMAVSSSIGSNIFDILVGLPIPWILKIGVVEMGVEKKSDYQIPIKSPYIALYVILLLFMVFMVIISIHFNGWRLNRGLGRVMGGLYVLFLCIVLPVELRNRGPYI